MTASNLIEGLQIIQKYASEKDYHIRAAHDTIWAGSLDWEMSENDKQKLEELGWDEDEGADGWEARV